MSERTVREVIAEMGLDTMKALTDLMGVAKYSTIPKESTMIFLTERFNSLPEEQRKVFWFCVGCAVNNKKEECD